MCLKQKQKKLKKNRKNRKKTFKIINSGTSQFKNAKFDFEFCFIIQKTSHKSSRKFGLIHWNITFQAKNKGQFCHGDGYI